MHATTAIVTGKPSQKRPRGGMTRKRPVDWLMLALVVIGALLIIAPFYLVLVNSFKSPVDYATSVRSPSPRRWTSAGSSNSGSG